MLFVTNKSKSLKNIIFSQHEFLEADELNILTGYIGPSVIEELRKIELEVKIIYGLAREKKLNKAFYEDLCALSSGNTQIYCPERLSHAKIYIWKNNSQRYTWKPSSRSNIKNICTVYEFMDLSN